MAKVEGITALGTLQAGSTDLTSKQVEAHGFLMAWIQDVAEGILKEKGESPSDWPTELRSKNWFDTWVEAFVDYTEFGTITSDQSIETQKTSHSGNINVGAIIDAAMKIYVTGEALATYETLSGLLGNPDTKVTDFADFWWDHVSNSEKDTGVKFGPAISVDDGKAVEFTAVFYTLSEKISDWRTLFVSSHFESLDVYTIGLTFKYTDEDWKEFGEEIIDKLSEDVKKSIKNAPLG